MSVTHLGKILLIAALLMVDSQAQKDSGTRREFVAWPARVTQNVKTGVPDANGCFKKTITTCLVQPLRT
ncbi:uncharacterized protein Dvir_GJ25850 [Drosophila virilis]|uniref:Uncharacterized protein n=1 Tax=Drosophila virilis TaxID=7244 RepID=A0A0Q9WE25_DROVI|nr:uncharacterized protein Dvir_GJ25850 [Drosophila virilis]